jgi:hypothetical protein
MPLDSGQLETCDLEWWIMLYHVAVWWEHLGVVIAGRTITASMCIANSEIWRKWHYSVRVFFMEWTWPSHNTARKLNVEGYILTRYILSRVEDQFGDDDCLYQHDNASLP